MQIHPLHDWNLTPPRAIALQAELSRQLVIAGAPATVRHVAGVDIGFEAGGTLTRAAAVVLAYPSLVAVERVVVRRPTRFPYVPGLLSFREGPAALDALARLTISPDLVLYDGQGIAHPRRFGIACHLGLITGLPSIGVAKTRLVGRHDEPGPQRGAWTPLVDRGETIGAVLRSRAGVKPLYVSPGYRIDLAAAIFWTMACVTRYRLPETTRHAHRLASAPAGD